jgi:hydroxyacylglutathione hydrolase
VHVLDVRRDDERREHHVPGSQHVPLHELLGRLAEVPGDRPVWVHCASGYRAGVAGGVLDRAGKDVVLVDDAFDRAVGLGLTAGR